MNRSPSMRRASPHRQVVKTLREALQRGAGAAGVLAAAMAFAPQAANATEPARGGELRVALPQVPAVPDPVVTTLGTNWLVASNVCEGLFGLDETWRPQPMLAQSFS